MSGTAPRPILFRGARLLDPESRRDEIGDLLVRDGVVAALGGRLDAPEGAEIVDGAGLCLCPGLIDMRTQLREPGEEHKETLESETAAAVAGGVTTLAALANTEPPIDQPALLALIAHRAAEIGRARIVPYGALTRGRKGTELTEMGLLTEAGAVGFTDSPDAIASAAVMRRALSYSRTFGQLVMNHPEEPTLTASGSMNEGEIATRLGIGARPTVAEVMMVERDLRLAELTGGRYHAGPLSTAAAIEAVRDAKRRGVAVTADTAPHYFALNETAVGEYRTFAKVCPPLRSEWDRRAVVAGLADGTIDAISSDHAPHDQDAKRLPFGQAAFGIIGLETLLPLSLELHHNRHLKLLDLIARLTLGPAKILRQKTGRLAVGAPADLLLFDLARPGRVEIARFRSKSKNSPFDGRPIEGRVVATFVGGRQVYGLEAAWIGADS
jgi:dihydroorotase